MQSEMKIKNFTPNPSKILTECTCPMLQGRDPFLASLSQFRLTNEMVTVLAASNGRHECQVRFEALAYFDVRCNKCIDY